MSRVWVETVLGRYSHGSCRQLCNAVSIRPSTCHCQQPSHTPTHTHRRKIYATKLSIALSRSQLASVTHERAQRSAPALLYVLHIYVTFERRNIPDSDINMQVSALKAHSTKKPLHLPPSKKREETELDRVKTC